MSIQDHYVRIRVASTPFHYYREVQTDVVDDTIVDPSEPGTAVADFVTEHVEINVPTATSSLLAITSNVGSVIVDDVTNITADPDDTKFVRISVVRKDSDSVLSILAEEKVLGDYAGVPSGYELEQVINEFSVVAAGTALVEV
jgi:hypothetical protein